MNTSNVPFLATEALAAGVVTKRTLRSRNQMTYRNVYLPNGVTLTPGLKARAAWLWSCRQATVAGVSAAALHGAKWIDPQLPAELARSESSNNGIVIHRGALDPSEICLIDGIPVTTPARTAFDLGRKEGLVATVIQLDALANATKVTAVEVDALATLHAGARGTIQLRRAVQQMDGGAESPQETRTRLVLTGAGLPKPTTQVTVYDEGGYPFARIDMAYEHCRVGIEYDGEQHWTDPKRRAHDIDKGVELAEHGWIIVRVSAQMLRYRPWVIVNRVVDALRAAGCEWLAECAIGARLSRGNVT